MRKYLLWLDLETTGLDPQSGGILEVAVVLTDMRLQKIAEYQSVTYPEPRCLEQMNDFCTQMHTASGLLDEMYEGDSGVSVRVAETRIIDLLNMQCHSGDAVHLAGNSVHFDRSFLAEHMPDLLDLLHYRQVDVSTIKVLAESWGHAMEPGEKPHRAMPDVLASIEELRRYRRSLWPELRHDDPTSPEVEEWKTLDSGRHQL